MNVFVGYSPFSPFLYVNEFNITWIMVPEGQGANPEWESMDMVTPDGKIKVRGRWMEGGIKTAIGLMCRGLL